MRHSESMAKIAPALVKALAEFRGAVKDSKNPHFKNDYASLESVIETARPVLASHGLAFMQGLGEYVGGAMTVSTRILHESGEWIESDFQMPVGKPDPQGTASASTYARRYSLMSILGLPAMDDDGEAAMARPARPKEAPGKLDVQPEGNDWWGSSGPGLSAAEAKRQGLGDSMDKWLGDLNNVSTVQGWKDFCAEISDDVKRMPMGWRVHMRNEAEMRGKELGAV